MLVKEIMKRDVVTIDADASVLDACMLYKEKKVGCLVVVRNTTCAGIVTERDLIERSICARRVPEKTKIHEIMSSNLRVVSSLDTVEKALQIMKEHKIKKLPVTVSEQIVGIVTITDIANAQPEAARRFMESWIKARWRD